MPAGVPVVVVVVVVVDELMFVPIAVPLTTSSTRRFICRPAAVLFDATGLDSP